VQNQLFCGTCCTWRPAWDKAQQRRGKRVREAEGRGRRGKRRKGGDVEERTGRKGLLQLLGLIGIVDAEGVEVFRAADFELCAAARLLDAHCPGVLPSRRQQEVFDLPDVLRLLRSHPTAIITRSESQDPQRSLFSATEAHHGGGQPANSYP
jgi:hypothetical protein